jgi:hypothetical protein
LLRTVVEVAFEALPRVIGRGDDSNARSTKFRAHFSVGDRSGYEVGKVFDAPFGAIRERFGSRRPDQ